MIEHGAVENLASGGSELRHPMFHRNLTTPSHLSRVGPKAPPRVGVRYGLLQLRDLGFQEIVSDDQRANSRAHIAAANGDRLFDGGIQPILLFVRLQVRGHGAFQVDRRQCMFLFCSHGSSRRFKPALDVGPGKFRVLCG